MCLQIVTSAIIFLSSTFDSLILSFDGDLLVSSVFVLAFVFKMLFLGEIGLKTIFSLNKFFCYCLLIKLENWIYWNSL